MLFSSLKKIQKERQEELMTMQCLEHSLVVSNLLYSGFADFFVVGRGEADLFSLVFFAFLMSLFVCLLFPQRQDLGNTDCKSQNNTLPSKSRIFMQDVCQSDLNLF